MKKLFIKNIEACYTLNQNSFWKAVIVLCFAMFSACEDFVEVDPPKTEFVGEVVFEEPGTAYAALSAVYTKVKDDGLLDGSTSGVGFLMGIYADELDFFGTFAGTQASFYNNALIPTDGSTDGIWSNAYNVIYDTNAIIEGVNNSSGLSIEDKNQIKGEALFFRACIHFYLANLFGDIPYITTTNYQINTTVSKTPIQEVNDLVVIDLLESKSILTDSYITGERVRVNRGAASAFLARVYLYMQEWDLANAESTSIISNVAQYTLLSDLNTMFLKESTEAILQLKPTNEGDATNEGFYILLNAPPLTQALSNQVVNAFEAGDNRISSWTDTVTDITGTWYFPFKYKQRINTGNSTEYSIVLRLAEQYLIRAEARTQLGDIAGAQADLNTIRNRAGLANTTAATTNDLIDAILQERRVELFTEFGHRFFDLKRLGLLDTVLDSVKPGWDSTDALLPIPESELLVNPNLLPQNPGY